MGRLNLVVISVVFLLYGSGCIPIPGSNNGGEKIIKVLELPDIKKFQSKEGVYFDIGYIYKQDQVFYIPLRNYEERYVGYIGRDDKYLTFSKEQIDKYLEIANMKLPEESPISAWERIYGPILFGLIFLISCYYIIWPWLRSWIRYFRS